MPTSSTAVEMETSPITNGNNGNAAAVLVIDRSSAEASVTSHLAMWIWMGWFFFFAIFVLTLPIPCATLRIPWAVLLGIMLFSAGMTLKRSLQPKLSLQLGTWIMNKAADYFSLRVYLEDPEAVESAGPAIFVLEPHGVLPVGIFALSDVLGALRGHRGIGCISSACFLVPVMRHVFTWSFAETIAKPNIERLLNEKYSIALCPGGVQEVFYLNRKNECVLFLRKRLGFLRLALERGIPLIPTFTFGLNDTFTFYLPEHEMLKWLGRKIGFMPMMFFGVYGLPLAPPKPCRLSVVIGSPIVVTQSIQPSLQEILALQDVFFERLSALYEAHKEINGMGHIQLVIL